MADELRRLYSNEPDVRVFHKGDDGNRAEFGLNELLYDVCVCRTDECPSARQGTLLRYVTKALWQVESEFARDSSEALKDLNKLVIGTAENKLFVGPRLTAPAVELAYLGALLPAARRCTGNVYAALVGHPDGWPASEAGVVARRLTEGRWQPIGNPGDGRAARATSDAAYRHSNFFEQLVEHVFISEVLQEAWYHFGKIVEVLRSEVDGSGFDVVFECGGVLRHVQLKTSRPDVATASQKVNVALAAKPSGCVVWLLRHEDPQLGRVRLSYLFFGGGPGEQLPRLDTFKVAKHAKGDSKGIKRERPNIRVVPKRKFVAVPTTRELVRRVAIGSF